ncbi:hypothetical protein PUR71_36935 [Streptomyces sp. SP17BM10]|uniref:hypothetical protein n=1 Tax=Streptomyces sp. SP17BM10 TaxID=3002530 RepID=UPI002E782186|nr:hypothetical protein [Streptomyces sp. SP17BM10]MEE1788445.1 hypothetical protein [Streptomyces sp. SP17BM10]
MNDHSTQSPAVDATVHLIGPGGTAGPALAHGILAGPRSVLVPDPPQTVGDPWQRYLVRVGPASDGDHGDGGGVETLRVAGVSLAAVAVDGVRAAAAVLSLATSSRQAPSAASTTADGLVDSIRRHGGDLWAVFAELGYPLTRPPSTSAPGPASGAGSASGEDWWSGFAAGDVSVFAAGICCISVNCPPRC